MDTVTLDRRLEEAVAREDLDELLRLQKLLMQHYRPRQEAGEMVPRLEAKLTPELAELIGVGPVTTLEGESVLNITNGLAQAIRRAEFRRDKRERPALPTVVAEGDSWFLHPLVDDVLDHLRIEHFNVRSMAAAGDTAASMLADGQAFLDALGEERSRVFLFSGGANDLLGGGGIAQVVRPENPEAAPEALVIEAEYALLVDKVMDLYDAMCRDIATGAPDAQIVAHGYDHVVRIDAGPWLWPFLRQLGYTKERATAVVRVLLDRFNAALSGLAVRHANFTYVDLRGTVGSAPASWFDAIHPRKPGFGKAAGRLATEIGRFLEAARTPPPVAAVRGVAGLQPAGFGEAAATFEAQFGVAARGPVRRAPQPDFALPSQPGKATSEAISRGFDPSLTDFEAVKEVVRSLPPEIAWAEFEEPDVHDHIRDVIVLLKGVEQPEDPRIVAARRRTRPMGMVRRAEAGAVPTRRTIANVAEALFGETELEPVQILLKGYRAARAVGRVQVMNQFGTHIMHGSGFLVAPGIFLTNHHVLPDADVASRSFVIFDDETQIDGGLGRPQRFRITGELFAASRELDYALVSLEPVNPAGAELASFGQLPLIQESGKAIKFEPVSIVQHPGGDPKAVAIRNSFVMGRIGTGIYYTTDTLGGSSGSPVLNREWQVVALHHRYVPHPTDPDVVLANRGVRISEILTDLLRRGGVHARALQAINAGEVRRVEGAPETEAAPAVPEDSEAGPGLVESGVYAGLSAVDFLAAVARESVEDTGSDIPLPAALAGAPEAARVSEALPTDSAGVLQRVGPDGYRLIVAHEVSSRAHYEARLRNPILPGADSGVTIGIGYDLGHQSLADFRAHWGDLLDRDTLRRLEACIGKTRAAAAVVLPQVRSVSIPFDVAIKVFDRSTLPTFFARLNRHIRDDVLDALPPPCVGALVSLTFNRGASYGSAGDRFREMRAIKEALNGGRPTLVPGLIRAMKRLWEGQPNVRGLLRRRDEEAALFEAGIRSGTTELAPVAAGAEAAEPAYDPIPDVDEKSQIPIPLATAEAGAVRLGPGDVAWVSTFSNNPDYAHLPASAQGAAFQLDAALIERAIALGRYAPHFTAAGHLVVAIRGGLIMSGEERELRRDRVQLMEQKPDHRTFRCVIAVYHRAEGKVSAFRASTVPNRGGVAEAANKLNGLGGVNANMLPTGCYRLCVGTHHGSLTVPTVLRLGTGPEPDTALEVTTLRTKNDGVYGTMDLWDRCTPADNVHPAFSASTAEFSSLGCLTVPGRFGANGHSGRWAEFRSTAGFDGNEHRGTRYDLLLTTGMELAAIAAAGNAANGLRRLAHGSAGDEVRALQAKLGLDPDGVFGPGTKQRLTERETEAASGAATGIYSVATEALLGFGILT